MIYGTGNIFTSESPKAYAPLGYTVPPNPGPLRPEDYTNDTPLPAYPLRPPQVIQKPLGATFEDTESQRPGYTGSSRKRPSRDDAEGKQLAPAAAIVKRQNEKRVPLMLGKNVITDSTIDGGTVYMEKILKRERETTADPEEHKEAKKQKKELRIKFEGEEEEDVNEDTVKPENVLRMVDSSLVDTPEKKGFPNQPSRHTRHHSVDSSTVFADSRYVIRGNPPEYDYDQQRYPYTAIDENRFRRIPPQATYDYYSRPPPTAFYPGERPAYYLPPPPSAGPGYPGSPKARPYDYDYSMPPPMELYRQQHNPRPQFDDRRRY